MLLRCAVAVAVVAIVGIMLHTVKRLYVAVKFSFCRLLLLRLHQPKVTKIRRHRFVNRIINKQLKTVNLGV